MKLLVCVDGSEHSRKAAITAADFAVKHSKASIILLHVKTDKDWKEKPIVETVQTAEKINKVEQEKDTATHRMLEDMAQIFSERNLPVTKVIQKGNPAKSIVKVAREENVNLIFIGNRGHSGLKKMLLGSVSKEVAQHAHTDVWVVK